MTPVFTGILIWYIVLTVLVLLAILSNNFLYVKKEDAFLNTRRGSTIIHLLSSSIILLTPLITEPNSLNFYNDVIIPNIYSSIYILILLTIAAVAIGLSMKEIDENDLSFGICFIIIAIVAMVAVVILLLLVIPFQIPPCACKTDFYGEFCEQTCIDPNGIQVTCNGHGICQDGCVCEEKYQGDFCQACINKYDYNTNCTDCMIGYSELDDCTKCEDGRDIAKNCEVCFEDSYFKDPNYIFNNDSCTVCNPFYYKPSASIERGSYNEYLQFGETCQPCKTDSNGNVCNGHGQCQHFWTESAAGTLYEGLSTQKILGLDANGDCICDDGYAAGTAGTCEKIPGYDFENAESVCNGHGEPFITYKQEISAIYSVFDKLVCKCDNNFLPTYSDSESSCSKNSTDNTCVYGFFKDQNNICQPCPGGGFLIGCNAIRGGGTCQIDTGQCTCFVSYDPNSGGYTGTDCKTCANRNFFKIKNSKKYKNNPSGFEDPEKCQPCPGATGPDILQSCGNGYCITNILLDEFRFDSALFDTFKLATGNTMDLIQLEDEIGECICYDDGSSIDQNFMTCL
tara:strand:+ start:473 stop:2176 length:1704 start_codon:yes stop_codon:yes gene_type:complete